MKKAIDVRQGGKTHRLLLLSAKKQIPMLTTSISRVRSLKQTADRMGLTIPEPVSVTQLLSDAFLNDISVIHNIIVDDTEAVLKALLSARKVKNVEAISITTNDESDELI